MSGKMSRTKGHGFERWLAKRWRDLKLYLDAKRKLEYQASDIDGCDLQNTGIFNVQCKRYKKYVNPSKIEEITKEEGIKILVTKADKKAPIVCLYLEDFETLVKALKAKGITL